MGIRHRKGTFLPPFEGVSQSMNHQVA